MAENDRNKDDRQARLSAALRENLKRRKAAARRAKGDISGETPAKRRD